MNVEFTKEQYEKLMKLAYLGNWVVNGSREPEEIVEDYDNTLSYVLSKSKEFGLESLTEEISGKYYVSEELEDDEEIDEIQDEFIEETFYSELCDQLVMREVTNRIGFEEFSQMDTEEAFQLVASIIPQFEEEFSENGLDNVRIDGMDITIGHSCPSC